MRGWAQFIATVAAIVLAYQLGLADGYQRDTYDQVGWCMKRDRLK